jgi:hypothetical protein
MAVEADAWPTPQFAIDGPPNGELSYSALVTFNGQQIHNVVSVSTSTTYRVDDVVRSSITIELVGEAVLVRHPPERHP